MGTGSWLARLHAGQLIMLWIAGILLAFSIWALPTLGPGHVDSLSQAIFVAKVTALVSVPLLIGRMAQAHSGRRIVLAFCAFLSGSVWIILLQASPRYWAYRILIEALPSRTWPTSMQAVGMILPALLVVLLAVITWRWFGYRRATTRSKVHQLG
jgi:hypothetical protein